MKKQVKKQAKKQTSLDLEILELESRLAPNNPDGDVIRTLDQNGTDITNLEEGAEC